MESINSSLPEDLRAEIVSVKPKIKAYEKIALTKSENEKLEAWIEQIKCFSKGFLVLDKSDLVNFLIIEHVDALTPREMKRFRSLHYDPIKHINWIAPQIKEALAKQDSARVAELQAELRMVELHADSPATGALSIELTETKKHRRSKFSKPKRVNVDETSHLENSFEKNVDASPEAKLTDLLK